MKVRVILFFGLLYGLSVLANPVSIEEAKDKAVKFMSQQVSKSRGDVHISPVQVPQLKLAYQAQTTNNTPAYYVFNNLTGGFIIMSGDDNVEAVLGYSDSGRYDSMNIPDGLRNILKGYERQISHAISQKQIMKRSNNNRAEILPLIQTYWNQREPYNNLCPIDPNKNKRCITGCVATALAQLLYYHHWPEIGYGSVSYEWKGQTLSEDFTQTEFDWDGMSLTYDTNSTDDEKHAVANLMYYCALASYTNFDTSSSDGSVYSSDLRRLFGYKEPKWMALSDVTLNEFETAIYQDLQQQRPVLFSSFEDEESGHEMLIDGYRGDGYFHINFGWGGDKDGYYLLTAIDTDWYNFTTNQVIIYGIEPDQNAPLNSGVYPKESFLLSDDGTELVKWTGDEEYVNLGVEAALWNVKRIRQRAFDNCTALCELYIPQWITDIESGAFSGCTGLCDIAINEDNEFYTVRDGLLMNSSGTSLITCVSKKEIVIPLNLNELGSLAFSNCSGLKQITVQTSSPPYIQSDSFEGLDLSTIRLYVPKESVDNYKSANGWSQFYKIIGTSKPDQKKCMSIYTADGVVKEIPLFQKLRIENNTSSIDVISGESKFTFSLDNLIKTTFEEKSIELGDVNGDGIVDKSDVVATADYILGKRVPVFYEKAADVNKDHKIDTSDIVAIINIQLDNNHSMYSSSQVKKVSGNSQQERAMYIYRNDGRLNAFLMNQVDSMTFSTKGVDGIEYGIPAVQMVWTKDSLYKIPISSIDSIGYQTPEPIIKKDIFIIDKQNISSVANVDLSSSSIVFRSNATNLPKQGQIIFCDLEQEPFPMGFSGRVNSITINGGESIFVCETVGPEEIFDRLLMVGRVEPDGKEYSSARNYSLSRASHAEPTYNISTTLFDLVTLSGKGTVTLDYVLNINAFNSEPATFYMKMKHDFSADLKVGIKEKDMQGAFDSPYEPDEKVKEVWGWPIELLSAGPIHIDVNVGAYFSYGGEFSLELSGLKYNYTNIREFTWSSDRPLHIEHENIFDEGKWSDFADEVKFKAELSGKVSFGVCMEFAAVVWKSNWMSLGLEFKIGPELKGSISLDTDLLKASSLEAAVYKEFSENVKLTTGIKAGADLKARLKKNEWTILSISTTLFPQTVSLFPKLSKPSMPKIMRTGLNSFYTETSYGWNKVSPMSIKTTATNITLFPGPYGLAIYDIDGNELYNEYTKDFKFWHWVNNSCFSTSVNNYKPQKIKVYPQYKFLGFIPIKSEPAEITIPAPLSLSDKTVEVSEGKSVGMTCTGGWGYLQIDYTNPEVANVTYKKSEEKQTLKVFGKKAGKTTVSVKDVRSGIVQSFEVLVNPTPITLSTNQLKMKVGETMSVEASPKAYYSLESSNPDVADAITDFYDPSVIGKLVSIFKITAKKVGNTTITVTDDYHNRSVSIEVEVIDENSEENQDEDVYETGICSDFTPENGAILDNNIVNLGCVATFPWNGEMIIQIEISEKPNMSSARRVVSSTINGTYGSSQAIGCFAGDLKANTKYYWQVSYFDFEEGDFLKCSPIMSFTTGSE